MLKKVCALIMVTLMIAAVFTGCSKGNEDEKSSKNISSKGNKNERIITCSAWDINTGFVPCYSESDGWGSFFYLNNFYETLVKYDNGKIVPGLAESWKVNNNEITFNLRRGIKFTDGSDFNAEVVKKNFEMVPKILGEEFKNTFVVYKLFKEAKVVDDYTVKIVLSKPYYGALQELTMVRPMGMLALSAFNKEGLSKEAYSKTFGTGKYMIKDAKKGEDYTFVRNENYWGEKPQIKEFVVKTIADMDSRMMALRTGEIDMVMGVDQISYDAFSEFKKEDKFSVKISKGNLYSRNLALNTAKAPLNDKNIRLAIQHAVDKKAICDNLFYGIEEKSEFLFDKSLPYCNVDLIPYTYDIKKAKSILDDAGWKEIHGSKIREKNGKKLQVSILYEANAGVDKNLALAISDQLKEIGFDTKVEGLELMAAWTKAMNGDFTIFMGRTNGLPYEPYTDVNSMNKIGYHNPAQKGILEKKQIDLKIEEVCSTLDKKIIQEDYNYILKTLHDEAVYLNISNRKELMMFNKEKIKNYKFNNIVSNIDISNIDID